MTENITRNFDYTDIQIIRTIDEQLDKQNHAPSTKQISELLERDGIFEQKVPSRTIRYRISKLEEKGILHKKIPITHERKLGIGESFFLVEENPQYKTKFYDIINKNTAIDWYIPTYGKYNGYYIHTIYSLDSPYHPHRVFKLMKEKEIIKDYAFLNLVDYKAYGWNFDYFDKKGNWKWKWEIWEKHLQKELESGKKIQMNFETEPTIIDFDYIDVQILKNLYLDDFLTLKGLGERLNLSETQIGRRIKSMEKKGIIRGYRTGFNPFSNYTPLMILINAEKNMSKIFYHLSKIPYPLTIAVEKLGKFVVAIDFPTYEIREFLNAFYSLKPLIDSFLIQFWPRNPEVNMAEGFDFFDEEANGWIKLNKEYKESVNKIKNMH